MGWLCAAMVVVILGGSPTRAADDPPAARLAAIEARQAEARARFTTATAKAGSDEAASKQALDAYLKDIHENVEAAYALARATPDDPAGFDALRFVVQTNRAGPGDATARALRLMLERGDEVRPNPSSFLAQVALPLTQYPEAETWLRRVLERNPDRRVRADACYWLAQHRRHQIRLIARLRDHPEQVGDYDRYTAARPIREFLAATDPAALEREMETLLERVVREFADVTPEGSARPLGEVAAAELEALWSLNVGRVAPEIAGSDADGKPLRLGDFRNKVVVLVFSGEWCGPCRGMYPQERELVRSLRDRPFALLGVNTDDRVETLRAAIARGEITWPCWWDGGVEGPITSRWAIQGFPSVFVLDGRGVIRHRDIRGEDLDRAVRDLLNEMKVDAKTR